MLNSIIKNKIYYKEMMVISMGNEVGEITNLKSS